MEILEFRNLKWIYIEQTSYKDVEYLEEHYRFHPLDLKDCIGVTQRPKIDIYDDYLFLVFHFPQYDREQRRIRVQELNVFLGPDYLITLTNQPNPGLSEYFQEYKQKIEANPKPNRLQNSSAYLLYKVLDLLFSASQPVIDIIGERLSVAEEEVFSESKRSATMDLSIVRRNILTYQRLLEPQLHVIDKMVQLKKKFIPDELSVYFDDIHDGLERTWSVLHNYKDTVEGLDRTNETLISQRLNEIIRTLTVISVVTIIPGLIINFYGMNISLPFADRPNAFFLISGFLLLIMIVTYYILKRRRLT
ncbi:MAG: magnesium transporter CorA family protein [Candidatus Nomurabacteria bacterium]|nr:MAG: magnesium transporter CorA family protein [Candidatus Nomurabacteria bacterium]